MKFGQVENPAKIKFVLPSDHKDTAIALKTGKGKMQTFIGCAKWNKTDLKNFYPKGIKDELSYYSTQFNSIELNATFYQMPTPSQVQTWKEKTPAKFKFFPKLSNRISHFRRLKDVKPIVDQYCDAISNFEDKLGMAFLQLHDNFKPKDFDRLEKFVKEFPKAIPLAIEVRNQEWFKDKEVEKAYYDLMKKNKVTNVIVDTAGRRDMLHMRLTTSVAFIRYVGANDKSDYTRLDDWVKRIKKWEKGGLKKLYFFVHQNVEKASPLLSAYFIEKLNKELGTKLMVPKTFHENKKAFK
jgi:uncharacterized protein YecE (DUF72 family)